MSAFPVPQNEEERLHALRRYQILDTLPEAAFDRITRTAAKLFNVPVALVSLVDKNRQWMKSTWGLDVCETARETAFCAHTIIENEPLIVEDATRDPRFAANPVVTGIPGIRFYAGAPLRTSDGHNLGSLCVIDMQPRACSDTERAALIDLAATVIDLMELRLAHQKLNLELATRASTQEQVRSSEEKFRSVTQSVGDGIISSNRAGEIVFWNLGAEKIFGYREDEMIRKPLTEIMPERFRSMHTAGMARLQAGGEARVLGRTVELFGLHKSGREFPLELTLSSWTSGRETFYTGILRDITERARASEELKRSEARLAEAQEIARIGNWELDLATKKPIWSDQFYRLLGLVPGEEEPNFERLVSCIHPDDREAFRLATEQLIATKRLYVIDLRIVQPDGRITVVQRRGSADLDAEGKVVRLVGTMQDITERRQAEAQLQSVLDAATGVSVIATNPEGTITLFNSGAEAMLGYSAEEMIGLQSPAILHLPAEVEARGEELTKILGRTIAGFDVLVEIARQGEPEEREWTYVCKDGSYIAVALVVTATRNAAGEINGFLGIALDITERRKVREELQRAKEAAESANRAKGQFLANMSHEIRTPMNGIIGMTDLTLETKLNRAQREYLGMVKSSAHSLLRLINDILDFSKIEAGKMVLETTGFSLRDCINGTLRPLAIRAEQKAIELIPIVPVELPDFLLGDPMRLRQVLINLVDNAIKFTQCGEITVRVAQQRAADEQIVLHFSITDTGIGIPAATQALIFEAFAQADGSTTRDFGGTGLGLTIASQIVDQMEGRIWVESEIGKGATFHFTVQLGIAEGAATASSGDKPPGGKTVDVAAPARAKNLHAVPQRLHILLAEDNPINCAVTKAMLSKFQHTIVHAANGREAVAAVEREEFDLILMDVQMPEMDGFEATRLIREKEETTGRHTPIIAMTAHAMEGDRERCLATGMDGYLSKPMEKAELLETITATLLASEVTEKDRPSQGTSFSVANLLAHLDGNERLLHKLAALFSEHTPQMLRQTAEALEREDHAAVARLAHQLSGSLGNLRAPRAARVAADLGEAARLGDLARARKLAKVLNHEVDTISSRLGHWESNSAGAFAPADV